jgi:hypothetical protein
MKSTIESLRRLLYWNAACIDIAAHHPDAAEREKASDLAALLTPLSKGWGTDMGVALTGIAIQIHGGMGFIEETGVAQHYRDARITTIYEGTNGIQAMDLVGRKMGLKGGAVLSGLLDEIEALDAKLIKHPELESLASALQSALKSVRGTTDWLQQNGTNQVAVLSGATPYLTQLSTLVGGYVMARSAHLAVHSEMASADIAAKVATARFFCEQLLPVVHGLSSSITGDGDLLMSFTHDTLSR